MAKLSAHKINGNARVVGQWVPLGVEFPGMEILTRGFNDAYINARSKRMFVLLRKYLRESDIPNEESRQMTIDCMAECSLLDIRGIDADDGAPMKLAEFMQHLGEPDYYDIYNAVIAANTMVGRQVASGTEDAAKNS